MVFGSITGYENTRKLASQIKYNPGESRVYDFIHFVCVSQKG
jgi:hypothetical protein